MAELNDPLYAAVAKQAEGEEIARYIIGHVLDNVDSYVDETEHQRAVLNHVIQSCLSSSLTLLSMGYIEHQEQHTTSSERRSKSWQTSEEPKPCAIDSWARSYMATSVKAAPPPSAHGSVLAGGKSRVATRRREVTVRPGSGQSAGSRRQSYMEEAGGRSSRPGIGPGGPSNRSMRSGALSRAPSGVTDDAAGAKERRTTGGAGVRGAAGSGRGRGVRPMHPDDGEDAKLRKELEMRKQAQVAAERVAEREAQERAQLAVFRKELRGREYSYDHRGEVVILAPVDGDRLPSTLQEPNIAIKTHLDAEVPPATAAGNRRKGRKGQPQAREPAKDYIPQEMDAPAVRHDIMKLAPGVQLKEGAAVRKGPQFRTVDGRMTWDAYQQEQSKERRRLEEKERAVREAREAEERADAQRRAAADAREAAAAAAEEALAREREERERAEAAGSPDGSSGSDEELDEKQARAKMVRDLLATGDDEDEGPDRALPAWARDALYVPPGSGDGSRGGTTSLGASQRPRESRSRAGRRSTAQSRGRAVSRGKSMGRSKSRGRAGGRKEEGGVTPSASLRMRG